MGMGMGGFVWVWVWLRVGYDKNRVGHGGKVALGRVFKEIVIR